MVLDVNAPSTSQPATPNVVLQKYTQRTSPPANAGPKPHAHGSHASLQEDMAGRRAVVLQYSHTPVAKAFAKYSVLLLDAHCLTVAVDSKCTVRELTRTVCHHLRVLHPKDIFGLFLPFNAECADGQWLLLDEDAKVAKALPKLLLKLIDKKKETVCTLHLRIKCYVSHVESIGCASTLHHYYWQLRHNLRELWHVDDTAVTDTALLLAMPYAMQADHGDCNAREGYFDVQEYFPQWLVNSLGYGYLQKHAPKLHADHTGMTQFAAMMSFCREVCNANLAMPLNVHSFWLSKNKVIEESVWQETELRCKSRLSTASSSSMPQKGRRLDARSSLRLHISCVGVILNDLQHLTRFTIPWHLCSKISFDKRKITFIRQHEHSTRTEQLEYYSQSEELSKQIVQCCRAQHEEYIDTRVHGRLLHNGLDSGRASVTSEMHNVNEKYIHSPGEGEAVALSSSGWLPPQMIVAGQQRISIVSKTSTNTSGVGSDEHHELVVGGKCRDSGHHAFVDAYRRSLSTCEPCASSALRPNIINIDAHFCTSLDSSGPSSGISLECRPMHELAVDDDERHTNETVKRRHDPSTDTTSTEKQRTIDNSSRKVSLDSQRSHSHDVTVTAIQPANKVISLGCTHPIRQCSIDIDRLRVDTLGAENARKHSSSNTDKALPVIAPVVTICTQTTPTSTLKEKLNAKTVSECATQTTPPIEKRIMQMSWYQPGASTGLHKRLSYDDADVCATFTPIGGQSQSSTNVSHRAPPPPYEKALVQSCLANVQPRSLRRRATADAQTNAFLFGQLHLGREHSEPMHVLPLTATESSRVATLLSRSTSYLSTEPSTSNYAYIERVQSPPLHIHNYENVPPLVMEKTANSSCEVKNGCGMYNKRMAGAQQRQRFVNPLFETPPSSANVANVSKLSRNRTFHGYDDHHASASQHDIRPSPLSPIGKPYNHTSLNCLSTPLTAGLSRPPPPSYERALSDLHLAHAPDPVAPAIAVPFQMTQSMHVEPARAERKPVLPSRYSTKARGAIPFVDIMPSARSRSVNDNSCRLDVLCQDCYLLQAKDDSLRRSLSNVLLAMSEQSQRLPFIEQLLSESAQSQNGQATRKCARCLKKEAALNQHAQADGHLSSIGDRHSWHEPQAFQVSTFGSMWPSETGNASVDMTAFRLNNDPFAAQKMPMAASFTNGIDHDPMIHSFYSTTQK